MTGSFLFFFFFRFGVLFDEHIPSYWSDGDFLIPSSNGEGMSYSPLQFKILLPVINHIIFLKLVVSIYYFIFNIRMMSFLIISFIWLAWNQHYFDYQWFQLLVARMISLLVCSAYHVLKNGIQSLYFYWYY